MPLTREGVIARRRAVEDTPRPALSPTTRKSDARKGSAHDGPPLAMCGPCTERPFRKTRKGEPSVTVQPCMMPPTDFGHVIARQNGRCIRCGKPDLELLPVLTRTQR